MNDNLPAGALNDPRAPWNQEDQEREFDLTLLGELESIEVEGIDTRDYPDFVDAFISYAELDGRKLTDEELDLVNEDYDFVYEAVTNKLF